MADAHLLDDCLRPLADDDLPVAADLGPASIDPAELTLVLVALPWEATDNTAVTVRTGPSARLVRFWPDGTFHIVGQRYTIHHWATEKTEVTGQLYTQRIGPEPVTKEFLADPIDFCHCLWDDPCCDMDCSDDSPCTRDRCLNSCSHIHLTCDDDSPCPSDHCKLMGEVLGCVHEPKCSADQNPSTIDWCDEGACKHDPRGCAAPSRDREGAKTQE